MQLSRKIIRLHSGFQTYYRCGPRYMVILALVSFYSVIVTAQDRTVKIPNTNISSVLLLRNGQTFIGTIVKSAEQRPHYTLIDDSGNQLRFPNDQVEFVSDSILEVYAYRRATQIRNNAPACLALAQWCMQSRLFDQAQEQIDKAITISGRTATITRLKIRLDLLRSSLTGHGLPAISPTASPQIISADQVKKRINQFPDGVGAPIHPLSTTFITESVAHWLVAMAPAQNPALYFFVHQQTVLFLIVLASVTYTIR